MRGSQKLPVYKAGTQLVSHLYQTTKKAPRELRYTLVHRLLSEAVEALVDVDEANRLFDPKERLLCLRNLQKRIVRIGVLLATAFEQRCLSTGAMALCIQTVDTFDAQLTGWAKQTEKKSVSVGSLEPEVSM